MFSVLTPSGNHCLCHEMRYVLFENLHDDEICVKPFDSHPGDGGQGKEVDQTRQERAESSGHTSATACLGHQGVEKKHH